MSANQAHLDHPIESKEDEEDGDEEPMDLYLAFERDEDSDYGMFIDCYYYAK